MTRENTEVRKELERVRTLAQEERERWDGMTGEIRKLREETTKARREAGEGIGEVKKWLAEMGNENRERERIGYKNQASIMDSLTKLCINPNVSWEDHRSIYREITMLETAMGSTVRAAVSEAVGRLRLELRKIFESLAEDTPRPKGESSALNVDNSNLANSSQSSDTDMEIEEERAEVAVRKGYRGSIGGSRGNMGRLGGWASNPVVLDTPIKES